MSHIPKIYLETTIFNFPFADDSPQYRADTLRLFEEIKAGKFQPYTSVYVTEELDGTEDPVHREAMKTLIDDYHVTVLPASDEAERLAAVYIAEEAVKPSYPTDALHIAMAAVTELDFIRGSGLIPRSSAPAQIMQRLQKFGVKPKNSLTRGEGIINFLTTEPPFDPMQRLRYRGDLLRGGSSKIYSNARINFNTVSNNLPNILGDFLPCFYLII
ncbi:MAG: hypothetical protein LBG07_09995 [Treponema sp.]|nr:hypothetical protein [Treponema sp.]